MTGKALVVMALALVPAVAMAADLTVSGGGDALRMAVAAAHAGDNLVVEKGVYVGPLVIDRSLTVSGKPGAIIDGKGTSRVISIEAPDVTISGCQIEGSGRKLSTEDSAIFVTKDGDRAVIQGNSLMGNLIGVYLKGPKNAQVVGNTITGITDMRVNERGNGVQLWNTPGSVVKNNIIQYGRDGIFTTTSRNNIFSGNVLKDLRFAVHYMYTDDSEVMDNRSIGNDVGYAIMYSQRLKIIGNSSVDDRDHGILLNYANDAQILDNSVIDGKTKCVFIYNSHKNAFHGNRFQGCGIGVHFTAGSEQNTVSGNAFIGNETQVKYVGTRWLEWSLSGRGNYWSDHAAFDLNGDGIADAAFQPNDAVDQVLWRAPMAKLLINSPAVQVLKWAQSQFPALHPGGVVDSAPLMTAPHQGGRAMP